MGNYVVGDEYDGMPSFRELTVVPVPLPFKEWDDESAARTRNVLDMRIKDFVPSDKRSHRRREPVVIDGEPVRETLRQRLERESRELEVAVTQLANQLAKRTAQLEHLNRFPAVDPFEDDTTLQFEKSFPGTPDTAYSYVAHRVDGRWYLTGARSPQNLTWDAFVSWMGLGVTTVYQLNPTARSGRKRVIG